MSAPRKAGPAASSRKPAAPAQPKATPVAPPPAPPLVEPEAPQTRMQKMRAAWNASAHPGDSLKSFEEAMAELIPSAEQAEMEAEAVEEVVEAEAAEIEAEAEELEAEDAEGPEDEDDDEEEEEEDPEAVDEAPEAYRPRLLPEGVRCSQFIVKRDRQCLIGTRHLSGLCRDHRDIIAAAGLGITVNQMNELSQEEKDEANRAAGFLLDRDPVVEAEAEEEEPAA